MRGWIDGWIDRRMEGWMGGWMDRRRDGWMVDGCEDHLEDNSYQGR